MNAALAGYTRNTINIDSHLYIVLFVALWSIIYFIQKVFDVNDNVNRDGDDDKKESLGSRGLAILSNAATHGVSVFLEIAIVLLVCKRSVGQEANDRLWQMSGSYTLSLVLLILLVVIFIPGPRSDYWPPFVNLQILFNVYYALNVLICSMAVYYCSVTGISAVRPEGANFLYYMIRMYSVFLAAGVLMVLWDKVPVNLGICGTDIITLYRFATFAPMCYFVLKRDCQYWGLDVDQEEEVSCCSPPTTSPGKRAPPITTSSSRRLPSTSASGSPSTSTPLWTSASGGGG